MSVQALYVDVDRGPYAELLGPENCWGVERDAKTYAGPHPGVYHPPCGPWGRLKALCTKQDPTCGPQAVEQLLEFGGVLEHPAHSSLWKHCELPRPFPSLPFAPGRVWGLEVDQCRWGHKCRKRTWLLFAGVAPAALPPVPPWQEPTHCIDDGAARRAGRPSEWLKMPSNETHVTPPAFAEWLVECARAAR
jgi:hypothetical protein